jgi:hypothetical protein
LCSFSFVAAIAAVALDSKKLISVTKNRHYEFARASFVEDFSHIVQLLGLTLGRDLFVEREDEVMKLTIYGEHHLYRVIDAVAHAGIQAADMPVFAKHGATYVAMFTKTQFVDALRMGIAQKLHQDPKRVVFSKVADSAWLAKVSTLSSVSKTPQFADMKNAV